jgi:hypothetical protein
MIDCSDRSLALGGAPVWSGAGKAENQPARDVAQRIVVHTHALARQGGHYLSVRTERSRKLLALAIIRRSGDSLLRVSRICQPD